MSESKIQNFFKDQTVFITGGTGFLGKVLVEKLLRLCEVKKIYLLVRPKKGKTIEERCEHFFNWTCFDRIRTENPNSKNKLVFIRGNCEEPNLGISKESEDVLTAETNVVIHAAANVKFDQPLRTAARINVGGTFDVLQLAKLMPKLKAFVYVSTAYSNCPHSQIDEDFYDPPMTFEQLLNIVEGMDDETLEEITPKLIGKWPNTYTYTKSIAEDVIKKEGRHLPVAMVRPAIITTTAEEPVPGWTDNLSGPLGIAFGAYLGLVRSINAKANNVIYLIPCDYVVNNILAAAWNLQEEQSSSTHIYNYVGSSTNFITWREFARNLEDHVWKYASEKIIWHYTFKTRENTLWHKICVFFLHTVVAYIVDFILVCSGKEPTAVKIYGRIDKLLSLSSYFLLRTWSFSCDNVDKLWAKMEDADRKLFNFSMKDFDWIAFMENNVKQGRVNFLKDPLETVSRGQKKIRILKIAHYAILTVLSFLLFSFLKCIWSCIM